MPSPTIMTFFPCACKRRISGLFILRQDPCNNMRQPQRLPHGLRGAFIVACQQHHVQPHVLHFRNRRPRRRFYPVRQPQHAGKLFFFGKIQHGFALPCPFRRTLYKRRGNFYAVFLHQRQISRRNLRAVYAGRVCRRRPAFQNFPPQKLLLPAPAARAARRAKADVRTGFPPKRPNSKILSRPYHQRAKRPLLRACLPSRCRFCPAPRY